MFLHRTKGIRKAQTFQRNELFYFIIMISTLECRVLWVRLQGILSNFCFPRLLYFVVKPTKGNKKTWIIENMFYFTLNGIRWKLVINESQTQNASTKKMCDSRVYTKLIKIQSDDVLQHYSHDVLLCCAKKADTKKFN